MNNLIYQQKIRTYKFWRLGLFVILFFIFLIFDNHNVLASGFQINIESTDWEINTNGIYKNGLKISCSSIITGAVPNPAGREFLIENSSGLNLSLFNISSIYASAKSSFPSLTYPASLTNSFIIKEDNNNILLYVDNNGLHYKEGMCVAQVCGNGIPETGEACDDGDNSDTYYDENSSDEDGACVIDDLHLGDSCQYNTCGDGYLNSILEECDDGNTNKNDGCSSECEIESCYGSPDPCFGRLQSYCDNGCTWNPNWSCHSDNDLTSANCASCGVYSGGDNCQWYVKGGGNTSFLADTKIDILGGFKLISDIREGDSIKSYDTENGEFVFSKVSFVKQGIADSYYLINNKIKVTGNHKFYTNKGLLKVDDLNIGNLLFDGGEYIPIISLQRIGKQVRVYTLGVDVYNNYFAEGILVHNEHDDELPTGCYGAGTDQSCWNQYTSCTGACQSPFSNCVECTPVARCIGTPLENCDTFSTRSYCIHRGCIWGVE